MSKESENTHIFDNPRNVKLLLAVFYAICFLLIIADFVIHRHITMEWEKIPAFYALYGFIAYVLLVVFSDIFRKLVMREEHYYDD